jgi:Leucine-rich repeat (LRR) protein
VKKGLSGMGNLVRLNLSGNLLERLPSELSHLTSLSTLRVKRNRLKVGEDVLSLTVLGQLKSLSIGSNAWDHQKAQELVLATLSLNDLVRHKREGHIYNIK